MISVPCPCNRDDFECNVGFQLALDSRNCVKSSLPLVGSVGPAEETEAAECSLAWEETALTSCQHFQTRSIAGFRKTVGGEGACSLGFRRTMGGGGACSPGFRKTMRGGRGAFSPGFSKGISRIIRGGPGLSKRTEHFRTQASLETPIPWRCIDRYLAMAVSDQVELPMLLSECITGNRVPSEQRCWRLRSAKVRGEVSAGRSSGRIDWVDGRTGAPFKPYVFLEESNEAAGAGAGWSLTRLVLLVLAVGAPRLPRIFPARLGVPGSGVQQDSDFLSLYEVLVYVARSERFQDWPLT